MTSAQSLQVRFLALLPKIETHARYHFRDVRCPDLKAERVAEVIALAWRSFLNLERRGKPVAPFVTVFATWVARAVSNGRRLSGMERAKDVFTARTQQRCGFTITSLPDFASAKSTVLDDALRDDTQMSPPDAAAFRIDFPRWLATLTQRNQGLAHDLMIGEKAFVTARKYGVSPTRICQLRQEFYDDWQQFHGEAVCANACVNNQGNERG